MAEVMEGHGSACVPLVRSLFLEYAASLGFDLCFQGFERELAELPGGYAPPTGRLLLVREDAELAGCIGLRKIGPDADRICEMKRLYVRPAYRGRGLGRLLVAELLKSAREIGYDRMVLDTLESMSAAVTLYQSVGFKECRPYSYHPVPGTRCFDLDLAAKGTDVPSNLAGSPMDKLAGPETDTESS